MRISRTSAVAALFALVVVACGGSGASSTTGARDVTTTGVVPVVTPAPSTSGTPAPAATVAFDANADPYVSQYSPIAAGTYLIEGLGTPFSLTTTGEWWVQPNEAGFFVLTHPDSFGPGDRDVVFVRPTGLADPTNPTGPRAEQERWQRLDDIDGWLDSLVPSVPVENRATTTLGGRDAVVFDVTLPEDFECGTEPCVDFIASGDLNGVQFSPGVTFRVYWVDGGEVEPIAVIVGTGEEGASWFDTANSLLDTVAFGEPGPHPVPSDAPWEAGIASDIPPGVVRLPVGDGISVELTEERFVFQNSGLAVVTLRVDGGVAIFAPVSDGAGNPVATVDDVVAVLEASSAEVAESQLDVDANFAVRVFTFRGVGSDDSLLLKWDDAPDRGWQGAVFGRIWLVDTPRGPLVVFAGSDRDEASLAVAEALGRNLVASLDLADVP